MSQQAIYVGIDGGGTSCRLVMQDADGHLLAKSVSGPANICLCLETSLNSVAAVMQDALEQAGLLHRQDQLALHVGFGLAGTEVPAACDAFLARLPSYTSMRLVSDAYVACLGAHAGQDGAVVIVGTGTVAYKMVNGQHQKLSGWGFPHSNEGSGGRIGLDVVRYTLQWLDGMIEGSPLLEAVFHRFDQDVTALVTWANQANASAFATLAPCVFNHLSHQDPWAKNIAQSAAADIALIARTLLQDQPHLPLCLLGGVAPNLVPFLADDIKQRIVPAALTAAEGALLMMKS